MLPGVITFQTKACVSQGKRALKESTHCTLEKCRLGRVPIVAPVPLYKGSRLSPTQFVANLRLLCPFRPLWDPRVTSTVSRLRIGRAGDFVFWSIPHTKDLISLYMDGELRPIDNMLWTWHFSLLSLNWHCSLLSPPSSFSIPTPSGFLIGHTGPVP